MCHKCSGWWSIAVESYLPLDREWFCPWCGERERFDEREFPVRREISSKENK